MADTPALSIVRRSGTVGACALALASLLSAADVLAQAPTPPAQAPAAPAPPPTPIAFEQALQNAANALFSKANVPAGTERIPVVIDPLIDGNTGAQSTATQLMERRIVELVKANHARFEVLPFTKEALAKQPVVLIGTFTAVNNAGIAGGARDAYRICLALADLKTRKIVAKAATRALPAGIDPTPTSFFGDSPVFAKDVATEGYVKSCQASRLGEPMEQAYFERIDVAVETNRAVDAYNAGKYQEALDRFEGASRMQGGQQLRVLNGLYLANRALNRREPAREAFARIVDHGLGSDRLAAKFLFNPNSAQFASAQAKGWEYGMWLREIAARTAHADKCLEVVGHTTATGSADGNERLSLQRAQFIQRRLQAPKASAARFAAKGVGSRELIVGTGVDDASDALDRRVEFKTMGCSEPTADRKLANPAPPAKVTSDRPAKVTSARPAKPRRAAAVDNDSTERTLPRGIEQELRKYIPSATLKQLLDE
jgi:outer membrane protein OmpA-like peptidoglycan-associated protein